MPTSGAPLAPGSYELGPDDATLTVHTKKGGAASKAGHDLTIEVTAWEATIAVGDEISLALTADPRSLRVREGHGGAFALGSAERSSIDGSIDAEVLKGAAIEFRSTAVEILPDALRVEGELQLAGATRPLSFQLDVGDGLALAGSATIRQSDWGMKPYSALFGTLKVRDEVRVDLDARAIAAKPGAG